MQCNINVDQSVYIYMIHVSRALGDGFLQQIGDAFLSGVIVSGCSEQQNILPYLYSLTLTCVRAYVCVYKLRGPILLCDFGLPVLYM